MNIHPINPKHCQRQHRPPNRLQRWWNRHRIHYRRTVESVPFDWSEPNAGNYPVYQHDFIWHERATTWIVAQRHLHKAPDITWNSEHLAFWFGKRSSQGGRQADGCDVDLDVYTFESSWWGTHTYTD